MAETAPVHWLKNSAMPKNCRRCAKMDQAPCRFPDQALASLEAYGVNVSLLAPQAGMQYINGANTVTYFGAIFLGKNTSRRGHGLIHQRRLRKCAKFLPFPCISPFLCKN